MPELHSLYLLITPRPPYGTKGNRFTRRNFETRRSQNNGVKPRFPRSPLLIQYLPLQLNTYYIQIFLRQTSINCPLRASVGGPFCWTGRYVAASRLVCCNCPGQSLGYPLVFLRLSLAVIYLVPAFQREFIASRTTYRTGSRLRLPYGGKSQLPTPVGKRSLPVRTGRSIFSRVDVGKPGQCV